MRTLTCYCCGADITAPQFHEGHAYGWTCIKKVAPKQKRTRDNGFWIKADNVEVIVADKEVLRQKLRATVKGTGFATWFYADPKVFAKTGEYVPQFVGDITLDGLVKIAKYANGSTPLYSHIDIIQERDKKGKLFVADVVNRKTGKSLL